ncbi:proline iminopeptidase [Phenylobacterium sp. Root77]|jgi:proline iminopeptidase|uniref:prolyl aminopeptidase n=1 Tax=unclassified Phenylobacterium TaxID=2640670 RepID=UPI0006F8E73F|nr:MULTISPECIES: prolyl aminopeptidase [unclassified Phenylobacterium]KQW72145.1 proline iminopeptidase [Phenylobacterium sp. Root1277]KQW95065.1 proline iminopeptidase [Phenylobacterium sp. Root1290]KRC44758.1 proline iminopeptidase [Phenylobacterium sp. Root77]
MERYTPPLTVSTTAHRKGLFPDNEPHAYGWLPTGGPHEIFYEECGNPNGKPCVILHGGPGGAINPTMRRFFNPAKWRMALFDQRGCGKSRPNASLDDNTTWTLIEDIERLRIHLGVEKWTVFGGSWGSTLALAYAITHPHRVEALVLRGVFLLTQRELRWFYQEGASMLFPDAWARFCAPIPEAERGDMMSAFHKRLTHPDRRIQAEAAAAWSQWEGDTISIRGPEARPSKFNEIDFAIAFARIECHFFANGGFFKEDNWILNNIDKIRGIPGWIVQGRFDVVTPMDSAWRLKTAWPEANFDIVWDAGHASTEPGIVDGLVRATDQALKL